MRKPRILWCGESSFLHTGYAIYGREVLNRLNATGKYDIAEFSAYGKPDAPEISLVPWSYYSNMPTTDEGWQEYNSIPTNQFGVWRFEDVCIDFKPDIVCDIRDWWMLNHEGNSIFRPFYHWMIMPAIDSVPLQNEWLETFQNADTLFTYSEFGKEAVEEASCNSIQVRDICSPCANPEVFRPVEDKDKHKSNFGFMNDIQIIGTVMRNQKRKLYPDLIESFADFCRREPETSENVYLYLHVSYPDIGWDIPRLINESGVSHKILLTYYCKDCNNVFPSFLTNAINICSECGKRTAMMPNAQNAVPEEWLSVIINCFDLYVQYSICEGFGMPQVEAASCGVPVMSMDYSAMSSVIKNIGATPIGVNLFREMETHTKRALPKNEELIQNLIKFFSMPKAMRMKKGHETYNNCMDRYNWDETAEKWEEAIDDVKLKDINETWLSEPRVRPIPEEIPDPSTMSSNDFVSWCVKNILSQPEKIDKFDHMKMLRNVNDGFLTEVFSIYTPKRRLEPYCGTDLAHDLGIMRNMYNDLELRRISEYRPEFILNSQRKV
jgi:glycosyltransferase involved in cell wall biosynthesis